jgi:hypothetical protein
MYPGRGCIKKGGKKKRREKTKKERKITQQKIKKHKFTPSSTRGLVTFEEKEYIA